MFLLFVVSVIAGNVLADIRGYRQGLGTLTVFPDIEETEYHIQVGLRNFYGINRTFLLGTSYNTKQISAQVSFLNIASFYRTVCMTFALRKVDNKRLSGGIAFTFIREFIPFNENRISFALSTGMYPFQTVSIHAGVYGIPARARIPFLAKVLTEVGETGILIEGEKSLPLKLLLFQSFKLSQEIKTYLSFSTSPNKLNIGILVHYHKLLFEPFSEIHDVLGQSGGIIVEYASSKSYN